MRLSLFILILFILFACNSKKKEHEVNQKNTAQVVERKNELYSYTVIFEQREDAKKEDYPSEDTPSDISHLYYMDNFQFNHFQPNDKEEGDTLNLEVSRKNLLIDLTYFQIGGFPFLIEANDTLIVKYQNGVPIVKAPANREHRKYDFAYDSLRMAYFKDREIGTNELFELLHTTRDFQSFISQKKEMYEKESKLIDSLYANNLLSKPYYEILKEKSRYRYLNLLVSSPIQKNFDSQSLRYKVKDLNKNEIHQNDLNKAELLNFTFYYSFLVQYMYSILNKSKGLKYEFGFTHDSRSAFDSVVKDPMITNKKVKDYLLKHTLEEIYQYFGEEDFENYFSKFKKM